MKKLPICYICGKLPAETTTKRLVIDHDHKTDIIRGWLCDFCNTNLGVYESNKPWAYNIMLHKIKPSYIAWVNSYENRITEHLKNNTGYIYSRKRKIFRRLYISAFAN